MTPEELKLIEEVEALKDRVNEVRLLKMLKEAQDVNDKIRIYKTTEIRANDNPPTLAVPFDEQEKQRERRKTLLDAYDTSEVVEIDCDTLCGASLSVKFQGIYDTLVQISKDHFKEGRRFAILGSEMVAILEMYVGSKKDRRFFIEEGLEEIKFFGSLYGPRHIGRTIDDLHMYEDAVSPRSTIMLGDDSHKEFVRVNIKGLLQGEIKHFTNTEVQSMLVQVN